MIITSNFDAGNISVVSAETPSDIRLEINNDNQSEFYQWFYFRVSDVRDTALTLKIMNAGGAAYVDGWTDYQACASYDRDTWFRVPTRYEDGVLTIETEPEEDSIYFAYFAPYSMERHLDLIADISTSPLVRTSVLGHTLDGQALDLVEIGYGPEGRKPVWLMARQHPGESMAEWWMEGALDFLLDDENPVARKMLDQLHFYIVPNMNPDGSQRGHLRTNAAGINLNREWADATMEKSPEVYLVRKKMHETGVAFHMDVHGDEGLPYNFLAGYEGIPSLTDAQLKLFTDYQDLLCLVSPDFQKTYGYAKDAPGTSDLKKCTDYVAETFGCLAMTLEMPFKDNADMPDADFGWSPDKCRHLAHACLTTLFQMMEEI